MHNIYTTHKIMPSDVVFVRHGQSYANKRDIIAGTHNSHLTPDGRSQAISLKERLSDFCFRRIITSRLHRAYETAIIVAENHPCRPDVIDALHEIDFGNEQGNPKYYENGQPNALEKLGAGTLENGETIDGLVQRAKRVIDEIRQIHERPLLVVGHGSFTAMIFWVLEGQPDDFVQFRKNFEFHNGDIKTRCI